jgi:mannitol/fructose-specific phosphotransferase system IIA component (Ntr-type)
MGGKVTLPYVPIDPKVEDGPLLEVTRKMIADIAHIYRADFGDRYAEVEQAIFTHLKPAAHRLRFGMYHRNPLYEQIVSNYNSLFINTRIVCRHLEEYLHCPMNEHEVSFITLHFGAALRKINLRVNSVARVLVVCDADADPTIGQQIEKQFNVEMLATLSPAEASAADKSGVDCIITTLPAEEGEIRCIQVSPRFGGQDLQKIGEFLPPRIVVRERYDREVAAAYRKLEEMEQQGTVDDRLATLFRLLSDLMNDPTQLPEEIQEPEAALCDLLTPERINRIGCGDNWREAIRLSSALLEKQGAIAPSYKEAIIHYLEKFGPYMVMLPGIALAHASPEDGALELGISLSLLERPVRFGYQDHDPVKAIFILSTKDEKSHLKALEQLFRMLKDKESLQVLEQGNPEEILKCIARFSD